MWHTKIQTGSNKWGISNTGLVIVKVSRCGCSSSIIRSFTSFWVSHPLSSLCLFFHIRRGQEYNTLYIAQIWAKWVDFRKVVTQKYQIFSFHEGKWRGETILKHISTKTKKTSFWTHLWILRQLQLFTTLWDFFSLPYLCVCFPTQVTE